MMPINAPGATGQSEAEEAGLPRRDWLLLPLIGLVTVCGLVAMTVGIARHFFSPSAPPGYASIYDCIRGGSTDRMQARPNAVCLGNARDEPFEEYRMNSVGNRAGMELAAKPKDAYRVVMVGSSYAFGEGVPMEHTVAALLPKELTRETGRPIQLYNEGMIDQFPGTIAAHFSSILPAQPDLALWVLTTRDVMPANKPGSQPGADGKPGSSAWRRVKVDFATMPPLDAVSDLLHRAITRHGTTPPVWIMLQHFLFASQTQYLKAYLMNTQEAEYLQVREKEGLRLRMQLFESSYAQVQKQAAAAGVPLVAVYVPDRGLACLLSTGKWPESIDPYRVDNALRSIVATHGGVYLDLLPEFRSIPDPGRYYFEVSDHPNDAGNRLLAKLLAKEMTAGAIPALKSHATHMASLATGK